MELVSNACGFSLSIFAANLDIECMLNDMQFLDSPDTLCTVLLCSSLTEEVQSAVKQMPPSNGRRTEGSDPAKLRPSMMMTPNMGGF